jgi:hypothetical protein
MHSTVTIHHEQASMDVSGGGSRPIDLHAFRPAHQARAAPRIRRPCSLLSTSRPR